MFPCASSAALSTAATYCQTITASGATATNYPTRAVSACGTTPARYLSACSCGPTCTTATPIPTATPCPAPNPTSGNVLSNSDFECGLAPWKPQIHDPSSASYLLTTAAASAHTGTHAFEVTLHTTLDPARTRRQRAPHVPLRARGAERALPPDFLAALQRPALRVRGRHDQRPAALDRGRDGPRRGQRGDVDGELGRLHACGDGCGAG
ncbi:hypothetical protein PG997_002559 [Apiospora hydei]|uniref:Uncharacterized protein n=1 Tax=Apiospora hydei TaxID=1337664 RepID=A0ABR1WWV0_9PEZI